VALSEACGIQSVEVLQESHRQWINEALGAEMAAREDKWSKSVAVGSDAYVGRVRRELEIQARGRGIGKVDGEFVLREESQSYSPCFGIKKAAPRRKSALYKIESQAVIEG